MEMSTTFGGLGVFIFLTSIPGEGKRGMVQTEEQGAVLDVLEVQERSSI